jgi:hypothetical protein
MLFRKDITKCAFTASMLSCAEIISKRLLSKTHAEKIFSQNALLIDQKVVIKH